MDAQIERHQPLITARLVFAPKTFPPPPIITARMEFPSINVPQHHQRSPTPEITPKRRHTTPKSTYSMDVDLETTPRRAATPTRHPMPKDTQRSRGASVTFQDNIDLGSPLTTLTESDEEDGEINEKIPKPSGTVGRPQSGGYNLQEKLTWNDRTYQSIMALVHKLAKTRLDTGKSFRGQDVKKIKQICDAVSKEYPILRDYERDWPTRDMLLLHLKYTSEAARRSEVASIAKKIEKIATRVKSKEK